jgi:rRNA maturation endonuclease Nob1
MTDWHYCENCDTEFKVISDDLDKVEFCPSCGEEIVDESEDDEDWDE